MIYSRPVVLNAGLPEVEVRWDNGQKFYLSSKITLTTLFSTIGALFIFIPPVLRGQVAGDQGSSRLPESGNRIAFEVASVKPNKSAARPTSSFPLGPGTAYTAHGGNFFATNLPLMTYIAFAYKISSDQMLYLLPHVPDWVTTERFDIQARAEGNPDKDQMRAMMRSLLADRFKLAIRTEQRQVNALALVPLKKGSVGPRLLPHPGDASCSGGSHADSGRQAEKPLSPETVLGGFPAVCGGMVLLTASVPGRVRVGARNVTVRFIAESLTGMADLGQVLVDQTDLAGMFDFMLEWTPEFHGQPPPDVEFRPDPSGPSFQQALREQLGLKLVSVKSTAEVLVIDRVERPTEN